MAADVAAILDALGVERFATYGGSGGGPHALACAALLPTAAPPSRRSPASGRPTPPTSTGSPGMGEGNHAEIAAAREGREPLVEYCRADAAGIAAVGPEELAEAMRPHLSAVDAAALTGELAAHVLASVHEALEPGVEGWVDDDYAFLAPGASTPARDRASRCASGRARRTSWSRRATAAGCSRTSPAPEGGVSPGEGHLTLVHRSGDLLAWLGDRLARA